MQLTFFYRLYGLLIYEENQLTCGVYVYKYFFQVTDLSFGFADSIIMKTLKIFRCWDVSNISGASLYIILRKAISTHPELILKISYLLQILCFIFFF